MMAQRALFCLEALVLVLWWITHEIGFHAASLLDPCVRPSLQRSDRNMTICPSCHEGGFLAVVFYFISKLFSVSSLAVARCIYLLLPVGFRFEDRRMSASTTFFEDTVCISSLLQQENNHLQLIFLSWILNPGSAVWTRRRAHSGVGHLTPSWQLNGSHGAEQSCGK